MSRAYEFERLTQAGCGSIDEYANRFLELSVYASGLVDTERRKCNDPTSLGRPAYVSTTAKRISHK